MNIKKFQAQTETEAILLAKDELGKDAIVMNIKTINPKGIYRLFRKPNVEVTAAVDDNISYTSSKEMNVTMKNKNNEVSTNLNNQSQLIKDKNSLYDVIIPTFEAAQETAIEKKLNNLQNLIEKQIHNEEKVYSKEETKVEKKEDKLGKNSSCIQLVYNQLIHNEVDEKYANQLIHEIEKSITKDTSVDNVLANVYQKIILKLGEAKEINITEGRTKYVVFVGPTGVGKTTTIAKIASSMKLKNKLKIALVTSDTYRIAAVEQLRTYANILGIPLKVVYSEDQMEEVKKEYENYDVVLIDTAGRSHKNIEQRNDIERFISAIDKENREVYLVLSATTKYQDLVKIVETYSEITDYNLIFTKLDETNCIGNIYNIKLLANAPLSYMTWGQNVPDDIGKANAQNIAKQLLGGDD